MPSGLVVENFPSVCKVLGWMARLPKRGTSSTTKIKGMLTSVCYQLVKKDGFTRCIFGALISSLVNYLYMQIWGSEFYLYHTCAVLGSMLVTLALGRSGQVDSTTLLSSQLNFAASPRSLSHPPFYFVPFPLKQKPFFHEVFSYFSYFVCIPHFSPFCFF